MFLRSAVSAAAALLLGGLLPASPAGAEGRTLYHYLTDDGTWAFTDDAKNIPPRYQDRVRSETMKGLDDYRGYTPVETPGASREPRPPTRAPEESSLRAPEAAPAPQSSPGPRVSVRTGGANAPIVDVAPGDDRSPVVIEKRRYRAEGSNVTRSNTIIRQGDRILTVIKPQPNSTNVTEFEDEADLER